MELDAGAIDSSSCGGTWSLMLVLDSSSCGGMELDAGTRFL